MTQDDFTTELAALIADGTLNGSGWHQVNGGIEGTIEYSDGTRAPVSLHAGVLSVNGKQCATLTDACKGGNDE